MKTGEEIIANIVAKQFLSSGKDAVVKGNKVIIHDFEISVKCTERSPNQEVENACKHKKEYSVLMDEQNVRHPNCKLQTLEDKCKTTKI